MDELGTKGFLQIPGVVGTLSAMEYPLCKSRMVVLCLTSEAEPKQVRLEARVID